MDSSFAAVLLVYWKIPAQSGIFFFSIIHDIEQIWKKDMKIAYCRQKWKIYKDMKYKK